MARRRHYRKRRRAKGDKPEILTFEIEKHIAREIWAVVYLALAAMTWLSLGGSLGIVGDFWVAGLKPLFGVGVNAIPFILVFMGASVFLSKKISWGLARLTGLFCLSVAILGSIHLQVPQDEMLSVAKEGGAGGYIGFVSSFIFGSSIGKAGAYIFFFATFLIGVLLTIQVSLADIVKAVTPSPKQMKKTVDSFTPEFKLLDGEYDDVEEEDQLKIVNKNMVDEDDDSMMIKQVSPKVLAAKIEEDKKEEESDGEAVLVDKIEEASNVEWEYPSLDLLEDSKEGFTLNESDLKRKADLIRRKLEQFDINVTMHEVHVGPTVVQYTLKPAEGVKLSKITSLKNDLALALAASAVRIEAPIPGKSLVGIEIPNENRATVHMREMMETDVYKKTDSKLKIVLGRDVSGDAIAADLSKMPHLLIAGATGSGKSVGMNSFLISLLYNNSPKELRMIMIDPKQVELSTYNGLPHLLTPVITEPEKAATALRWAVAEMNRRYKVCAEAGHRSITEYNKDRKTVEKMPKIVIVIDELADLMMTAQKEVEASICRIAQMARAVGMHLIVATQRPSVDVVTGLIKANIPARIAFTVASSIDSRTILDCQGAEDLLGMGDMLYLSGTMGKPIRVQGIYISSKEIEAVTNKMKLTREPHYRDDITAKETQKQTVIGVPDAPQDAKTDDELMNAALECLRKNRKASSTSSLQRYLRIGYSRAARIIDMLEEAGYVGPANGSKPRDVHLPEE